MLFRSDVWRIDAEQATRVGHPAPFPVELPRRLIDLYTYRDDVVLDPFMGSGSTLVAAVRSSRRGIGYDLDPEFVALAEQRVAIERKRVAQGLTASWRRSDLAPTGRQEALFADRDAQEQVLDRAADAGKKAADIAEALLDEAGFEIVRAGANLRGMGVGFPFLVTDRVEGHQWYVDVAGTFTTSRPGMRRNDVLWKTIGRAHVLAASGAAARLPALPSPPPRPPTDRHRAPPAPGRRGPLPPATKPRGPAVGPSSPSPPSSPACQSRYSDGRTGPAVFTYSVHTGYYRSSGQGFRAWF